MPNDDLAEKISNLPTVLEQLAGDEGIASQLANADSLKENMAALRPFDGVEQMALDDYAKDWLVRYVYNSNAIEGSTLTLEDTSLVVEGEFIPSDSPARYVFAARGVADGMAYVRRFADEGRRLDLDVIQKMRSFQNVILPIRQGGPAE
jgi:Fic family protein